MVQVASLRIQIDASQAAQSASQLRRELDGVAASSRGVAAQAAPVAASLDKNTKAATIFGREIDRMGLRMGKVQDLFGSLGRKSAIFLGADVLARAAGFNSLMGAMSEGLDKIGKGLRDAVLGPDTLSAAIGRAANESVLSLDDLVKKLGEVKAAALGLGQTFTFGDKGKGGQLNFFGLDLTDAAQASKVEQIVSKLQADIRAIEASKGRAQKSGLSLAGLSLIEEGAFQKAQGQLKTIAAEFYAIKVAEDAAKESALGFAAANARGKADLIQYQSNQFMNPPNPMGGVTTVTGTPGTLGGFGLGLTNLSAYVGQLKLAYDAQERLKRSGEEFGAAVGSAFENAVFMTGTLRERLSALFQDITRAAFSQLVTKNVSGAIAGMFAADGAAFGPSGVIPFAYGGIVSSPTMFGFGGNKTGLMGEAGPEAVMPLKRGADGKLGVQGGGGGNTYIVNQYISTPNPASFGRSQRQIAAQLRGMMG